jgi:hypothetical protein
MTQPITIEISLADLEAIRSALVQCQCVVDGVPGIARSEETKSLARRASSEALLASDLIAKNIRKAFAL